MRVLDNSDVKLWYSNTEINQYFSATIKLNKWCDSRDLTNLGIHCKDEYKLNGKLDINKFDSHWLNQN